jgi:hypothetical protein
VGASTGGRAAGHRPRVGAHGVAAARALRTTRFIIRTPIGHERVPVWAAALDMAAFQLPHFIMERRMMLRIKALAESSVKTS